MGERGYIEALMHRMHALDQGSNDLFIFLIKKVGTLHTHCPTMRKSAGIRNLFFKFYLNVSHFSQNVLCYESLSYVVHW